MIKSNSRGYYRTDLLDPADLYDGQTVWCITYVMGGWEGGTGRFDGLFRVPGHIVVEGTYRAELECAEVINVLPTCAGPMNGLEIMTGRDRPHRSTLYALDQFWLTKEEPLKQLEEDHEKMRKEWKEIFSVQRLPCEVGEFVRVDATCNHRLHGYGFVTKAEPTILLPPFYEVRVDGKLYNYVMPREVEKIGPATTL